MEQEPITGRLEMIGGHLWMTTNRGSAFASEDSQHPWGFRLCCPSEADREIAGMLGEFLLFFCDA